MNLTDLYKKVLVSLGYNVDDEGIIMVDEDPVIVDGLPWAIPTKGIMKTLRYLDDDGKTYKNRYTLFDPYNDNVLEPETSSMKKLKQAVAVNISMYVTGGCMTAIDLVDKNDRDNPITFELSNLLAPARGTKNKLMVKDTAKNVMKLLKKFSSEDKVISVFTKRNYKDDDGNNWLCATQISSPILSGLKIDESTDDERVREIVRILLTHYTDGVTGWLGKTTHRKGTTFISIMMAYNQAMTRLKTNLTNIIDVPLDNMVPVDILYTDFEDTSLRPPSEPEVTESKPMIMRPSDIEAQEKEQVSNLRATHDDSYDYYPRDVNDQLAAAFGGDSAVHNNYSDRDYYEGSPWGRRSRRRSVRRERTTRPRIVSVDTPRSRSRNYRSPRPTYGIRDNW